MKRNEIKVIPRIRVDGVFYRLDELPRELVEKIMAERFDLGMTGIGYQRVNSA